MSNIKKLQDLTTQVRRDILRMVHKVNSGHPGGSLGCAEFFVALYEEIMYRKDHFDMDIKISDYHQHAISAGSDAKAVAYSELMLDGKSVWGVGMHQNTVIAGFESVISGLNRLSK